MELNKFYVTFGNYLKLFFLIYEDVGIGLELNFKTKEYSVDFWENANDSYYHTSWPVTFDLTQPRRDVVHLIFTDGDRL